jgi:putative nucleotidyltransferase with HDIG domain
MDEVPAPSLITKERLRRTWKRIRLWVIYALGLVGTLVALSLPISQQEPSFLLKVGDVAPRDILAPYALTFTSQVLTDQAREAAANAVPDQYDPPDSQIAHNQLEHLSAAFDFIDGVRADTHSTTEQKLADLATLSEVTLDSTAAQNILTMDEARWTAVKLEAMTVLEQVMRKEIRPARLEEEKRSIPALVSIALSESQANMVIDFVRAFIVPNAQINEAATAAAREEARQAVSPVAKSYAAGETIIGLGRVLTPLDIEALEAYGLLEPPQPWKDTALRGLLITVLSAALVLFSYRVHAQQIQTPRLAATLAGLFILQALGMQVMIPDRTVLPYLFPAATLPILLAVTFGPGMAVVSALITGILAGYIAPRGLELAFIASLSGVVGSLILDKAQRLTSFVWAGLAAGVSGAAIVIIFRFLDPSTDAIGKITLIGASLGSGILSAALALGLLLPIGNMLGIVTSLQLIELSRPDHPALQLLLHNAPGTYQHSLQVANLAEPAARAIGANYLLTRVGCLYHDIGKAGHPQFFIENQVPGQNVHEQLDPATSAGVIRSHVMEGMKTARKYRLPRVIQDFISEHHGTMETGFLYQEALQAAGGDAEKLDEREFSYPGPRPQSRETALVMLADGVEAKARADTPQNDEEIEQIVSWVIQDRLQRHQLDHTKLTLEDLDVIRKSFVSTLKSIYHPRLRYPQSESTSSAPKSAPDGA